MNVEYAKTLGTVHTHTHTHTGSFRGYLKYNKIEKENIKHMGFICYLAYKSYVFFVFS